MVRTPERDWRPTGIQDLEPQAWNALRHTSSTCVVAGPGAGKTEFLAQRAAYLLETGACASPFRILAISFKTDAAANLAARVWKRCPSDLARRFTSITFDAFTKGLVDRFLSTIPTDWRPTRRYELSFPTQRQIEGFLDEARMAAPLQWQPSIVAIAPEKFEPHFIGTQRLMPSPTSPTSGTHFAFNRWWHHHLRAQSKSTLTFTQINRLAELLLRTCPHICRALRVTYPFVFIDEFQDTTFAQYDFLQSAFAPGENVITAVGDDKQRIMSWAGARPDVFSCFLADFAAARIPLFFNFRSSPDLVRIQYIVAQALEPTTSLAISQAPRQLQSNVAEVWNSSTKSREAQYLAHWLVADMKQRMLLPRDYVLLVRQKADDYEAELTVPFAAVGLKIRNESHRLGKTTLQDVLSDDFCNTSVALLRLAAEKRAPNAWRVMSEIIEDLRGASPSDEEACRRADKELTSFLGELRETMTRHPPIPQLARVLASRLVSFLNPAALRRTYPAYSKGELLDNMIEAFTLHLESSATGVASWSACVDAFEGVYQVPLMTVHKSKGLEYDTIAMLGLDDDAWWSHRPGDSEGLATFFVALSRAKQRAIFAFCRERGQRRHVADFYQLLTKAGVPEVML